MVSVRWRNFRVRREPLRRALDMDKRRLQGVQLLAPGGEFRLQFQAGHWGAQLMRGIFDKAALGGHGRPQPFHERVERMRQ